jgi:Reverse transcriptase (RNA-dependent DNA polymerase)
LRIAAQSQVTPQSKHSQRAAALINEIQQDQSETTPRIFSVREAALPPPQTRPNTKPLFDILAKNKDRFNSNCPLRVESFLELLDDYPSPEFPVLLAEIIQYGAKLGYDGPHDTKVQLRNHPSANANRTVIADDIKKELSLNRLKKLPTLPHRYYCSPLGLVPKTAEGKQTGWRRIFDLSSPKNQSVNDHIVKEFGYLQYETFDEAVEAIAKAGPKAILLKRDLKSAFRMIPVCTEDQWLLIFEWDGEYYQELFLPFGLRTAPFIFNLFGEAFQWILHRKYSYVVKRYLDDFLFILPPTMSESGIQQAGAQFRSICTALGFSEAEEKSQGGTRVDYLGLILDTVKMEAQLPEDKKNRAVESINDVLRRGTVTQKQLQKLLGLLEFCAKVFPLGRPFLRCIWNMFRKERSGRQRLTKSAQLDLTWWAAFLPIWSGVSMIQISRERIYIATDASGAKGIGGAWLCDNIQIFSTRVKRRHRSKHINWKELFAIVYAFASWSEQWTNKQVIVFCDNEAVVEGVNKRSIRGVAIHPLQTLFLLAAKGNIDVATVWVPSKANALADALSRFDNETVSNLLGQDADSLLRRQPSSITSKLSRLMQPSTSTTGLPPPPAQK